MDSLSKVPEKNKRYVGKYVCSDTLVTITLEHYDNEISYLSVELSTRKNKSTEYIPGYSYLASIQCDTIYLSGEFVEHIPYKIKLSADDIYIYPNVAMPDYILFWRKEKKAIRLRCASTSDTRRERLNRHRKL